MLKPFKAVIKYITGTSFYKNFVFQFLGIDTYKDVVTGKKLIPIEGKYYETSLLIIHIWWTNWFTFWFGMWVSYHSLPQYFRERFLSDLWWLIKKIAYECFWVYRLFFVVTYINFAEYYLEFKYWWWIEDNRWYYPHEKQVELFRGLKKFKIIFLEKFFLKIIWNKKFTLCWFLLKSWKEYS